MRPLIVLSGRVAPSEPDTEGAAAHVCFGLLGLNARSSDRTGTTSSGFHRQSDSSGLSGVAEIEVSCRQTCSHESGKLVPGNWSREIARHKTGLLGGGLWAGDYGRGLLGTGFWAQDSGRARGVQRKDTRRRHARGIQGLSAEVNQSCARRTCVSNEISQRAACIAGSDIRCDFEESWAMRSYILRRRAPAAGLRSKNARTSRAILCFSAERNCFSP